MGKSACEESVVKCDKTIGLVVLILNIIPFTAGIGTMVSACAGKSGKFNGTALLFGILQWLLLFLLIGWIWSIIHGVWVYQASR